MADNLYEKMVAMGIDMTWYDRQAADNPTQQQRTSVKLFDKECGLLSIYLLDNHGRLYSLTTKGEKYMQVRATNTKLRRSTYLCAHCNKQFADYQKARSHYESQSKEKN